MVSHVLAGMTYMNTQFLLAGGVKINNLVALKIKEHAISCQS